MSSHTTAKHRAPDRIELLEAHIRDLESTVKSLTCELTSTLLRGMRDATALYDTQSENDALKARNQQLASTVIRDGAEKTRLRQAVINARPRITETVQRLDRPYVSHVQIPYPVPVQPADTVNEQTQQMPILDLPETAAWPSYRLRFPVGPQAA
ncbi:hypothetical protein [Streptomyces sp. ok210]|uniref:hypothetical protein n=1 Tax=Streptomyces sp. ok210 TaxID=1761905 RepID=UPI0008F2AD0E|nr:hypothetical protein [Streptomyces sp. ok210]SFT31868.1 hypothetical protein SAMN04487982_12484 [Streptomyces sp. ok210]